MNKYVEYMYSYTGNIREPQLHFEGVNTCTPDKDNEMTNCCPTSFLTSLCTVYTHTVITATDYTMYCIYTHYNHCTADR